jgi:ribosome recycling factor
MYKEVIDKLKEKNESAVESLGQEYKKLRTGRANPTVLQGIKIDYYGTPTPLQQLANIGVPEARLMVIQPYDASVIGDIEKAILKANLGFTPSSDGKIIRIQVPPLTQETRREIIKVVKKKAEDYRVSIRNNRRDANEELKKMKKDSIISEDEEKKATQEVQKITDDYIKKIDKIAEAKEKEINEE